MRNTEAKIATKAAVTITAAALLFVLLVCGIFCVNGMLSMPDATTGLNRP